MSSTATQQQARSAEEEEDEEEERGEKFEFDDSDDEEHQSSIAAAPGSEAPACAMRADAGAIKGDTPTAAVVETPLPQPGKSSAVTSAQEITTAASDAQESTKGDTCSTPQTGKPPHVFICAHVTPAVLFHMHHIPIDSLLFNLGEPLALKSFIIIIPKKTHNNAVMLHKSLVCSESLRITASGK